MKKLAVVMALSLLGSIPAFAGKTGSTSCS